MLCEPALAWPQHSHLLSDFKEPGQAMCLGFWGPSTHRSTLRELFVYVPLYFPSL